jgi:hypothetical protein
MLPFEPAAFQPVAGMPIAYCMSVERELAGAEGFEPPSPVLETSSLTVELTPLHCRPRLPWPHGELRAMHVRSPAGGGRPLLRLFVRRVLAAAIAELGKLQPRCRLLLVLGG